MAEYKIGTEIEHKGKTVLITRIVNSTSYFENHKTGSTFYLEEHYVETLSDLGEVEFITISERQFPCEKDPNSKIIGPDILPWRKNG